jgi:hypothetical protein
MTSPPTAPDRQSFLASQPTACLQEFARQLGWNDLRLECFPIVSPLFPQGYFALYSTTDSKLSLQIGPRADLGPNCYSIAVVASRYGIVAAPHQSFTLFDSPAELQTEIERLRPLFARVNFKNPAWRKTFARENPLWVMQQYRQRNKFLAQIRRQALERLETAS